jgi:hypothetical protein
MRWVLAVVLVAPLAWGCTPYMPVKDDFGTSAALPKGDIPPEYAQFNAYNAGVNPLLVDQICATPYQPRDVNFADATPGQIATAHGRCANHVPFFGSW